MLVYLEDKCLDKQKEDKAKIIEKFNVGDIVKDAVVKGYSSFGCFWS